MKIDFSSKEILWAFIMDFKTVQDTALNYFFCGMDYLDACEVNPKADPSEHDAAQFELRDCYLKLCLKWGGDGDEFLREFKERFKNTIEFIVVRMEDELELTQFEKDFIDYSIKDFNALCSINYFEVADAWRALNERDKLPDFSGSLSAERISPEMAETPKPELIKPAVVANELVITTKRLFSFAQMQAQNNSPVLFRPAETSDFNKLEKKSNSAIPSIAA